MIGRRPVAALLAMLAASACQAVERPDVPAPSTSQADSAGRVPDPEFIGASATSPGPFTPAVRAGHLLFLSGQIGTDSTNTLVGGGIEAETRQTLQNIDATLRKAGSSMDRVVKCTVFMADMKEWPAMNVIYATFFPVNKPARSAAGANGLALNARVEIECIALAGNG